MGSLLMDLKLDRAFGHLDVNANGYVEHHDVVALAGRLIDAFDESPGSDKGQALMAGFDRWWQALLESIDVDGDRRISPQEWNAGMVAAFVDSEEGFDRHFRPMAKAAFEVADTDGDGTLSRAEFEKWHKAFGTKPADVKEAFQHLDADGDAILSIAELIAAAKQFYTGRGHSSGDWLYGRIGS